MALGIESPGPQCAFETSMFMCPAVHTTTRILLRPSSTHEPSDPPFRVMFFFVFRDAHWALVCVRQFCYFALQQRVHHFRVRLRVGLARLFFVVNDIQFFLGVTPV